jgi:hypothetical protein
MSNTKKPPVHELRIGAIKATIWEQSSQDNTWNNVTFARIYKDGSEWKTAESYTRDDLLVLAKLADQAHSWICEQRNGRDNGFRRETSTPPRRSQP